MILGAGGHSKVVIATAEARGLQVTGVFDDRDDLWGQSLLGHPISGPISAAPLDEVDCAVIAVGDNESRRQIALRTAAPWTTIIHPSAQVHRSVTLAEGTVVFAGAVLQPDTVVGRHVIVNTATTADHDCRIGDFVHIAPGAQLAGDVQIGTGALIGVGATVMAAVSVGEWAIVGAGAVAIDAVDPGAKVAGVPAQPIDP